LSHEQLEELRARLGRRTPDAELNAVEAAIYTGRSTRTLKRAIDAGVGPRREKNPDSSGQGATNRHTHYRKADLDAWREGLVAFACDYGTFDDLAADAPWVERGGLLVGHLLDLKDINDALEALATNEVIFLRLDEALRRAWVARQLRSIYQEGFASISQATTQELEDAAQQDALEADTGPAAGGSRRPTRP
jgi:hypothetical protein